MSKRIKYLSAEQYGATLNPPIKKSRVRVLCEQNRLKGAYKLPGKTGAWLIPESAPDPRKLQYRGDCEKETNNN